MTIIVFGIANCDTVKKARAWLADHRIEYRFHDFRKDGVPPGELDQWLAQFGWEQVLNRQGTTWRKLDPVLQARVRDNASARSLLIEQSSAIKRPVVDWGGDQRTIGFDPGQWAALATG